MPTWFLVAGLVGATAAVVLFALIARRAQREVAEVVASLPAVATVTTVIGGAMNRRVYVSWPMAQLDITTDYLLIRPRWTFVPLFPVLLLRIDGTRLHAIRRPFGDRIDIGGSGAARFDAAKSQRLHERLASAGWPIER